MTTVAYRDGVLAADTQVTANDDLIDNKHTRKVFMLRDGSLIGFAGRIDSSTHLLKSVRKGQLDVEVDEVEALLVKPSGLVYLYEGKSWIKQKGKYFVLGSGSAVAYAAFDAGELLKFKVDAVTAVKVGIKRDPRSGGRVQSVRLAARVS